DGPSRKRDSTRQWNECRVADARALHRILARAVQRTEQLRDWPISVNFTHPVVRSKPFESVWGGIEGSCEPQIVDVRARDPASEARFDHIEYAGQEGLSAPAVEPQDIGKCRQQVAVRRS